MSEDKQTKIEQWLSEGDSILSDLEDRRTTLAAELKKVEDQIVRVKTKLGRTGAPSGAKGKVMIRPMIKQILVELEGASIGIDALVTQVQQLQPKATVNSIRTSIERAARRDSWCKAIDENTVAFAAS